MSESMADNKNRKIKALNLAQCGKKQINVRCSIKSCHLPKCETLEGDAQQNISHVNYWLNSWGLNGKWVEEENAI